MRKMGAENEAHHSELTHISSLDKNVKRENDKDGKEEAGVLRYIKKNLAKINSPLSHTLNHFINSWVR